MIQVEEIKERMSKKRFFSKWKSEFIRIASNERVAVFAIIQLKN